MNRYAYQELLHKAISPESTQDDVNALGEWFAEYGTRYWNGEYYDTGAFPLFPIMEWDEERDQGEIIGYEFR